MSLPASDANSRESAGDGEVVDLKRYFKHAQDTILTEPLSVRRRVKALKKLMAEGMVIESRFYDEISSLERKYEALYQPIYDKRSSITNGKYEPNDEECLFPEETDETYDMLRKARTTNENGNGNNDGVGDEAIQGIPYFWLTAMKNVGVLAEMIEAHDEPVLRHLENVSVELREEPLGFKIHFHFSPNEYFTNQVLTKTYTMKNCVDERCPLSYDGPEITNCEGCQIDWKENHDVTQIVREKKCRDHKTGAPKAVTEKFKVPSFFDFFSPPQLPTDPSQELDEDVLVRITRDFDIGQFLRETFVPHAVLHYTGEADVSDDEESDDELEEEGDSDYAALSDDAANLHLNQLDNDRDPYKV